MRAGFEDNRYRGAAAADVRNDGQFNYGDIRKLDTIFLNLARCGGRADIPLLAYKFANGPAEQSSKLK
jgi:hypothetical protein